MIRIMKSGETPASELFARMYLVGIAALNYYIHS